MTLSISDLPRVMSCAGSAVLPQARSAGVWADRGRVRHAIAEGAIAEGRLDLLPAEIRDLMPKGSHVGTEVAIAYDVATDTARLLEGIRDRNYGAAQLAPSEIPGTIDLFVWRGDEGKLIVVDYKGFEDIGDPDRNAQLLGYALALARVLGVDEVTVIVAYLKEAESDQESEGDDENDEDGDDDAGAIELARPLVVRTLDAFDLDAFAARLRELAQRVEEQRSRAVPDVSESRLCKYCPAAPHCPAKTGLIRRLASGAEADQLELLMPLTPETAAIAYERIQQARQLLKRVETAIYALASQTPIRLPTGKLLGNQPGNEQIDGAVAQAVLRERYGESVAAASVRPKTAKKWIREALKTAAGVASVAAAEEQVLVEIRKRGGAKRKTKIREYYPKDGELDGDQPQLAVTTGARRAG